MMWEHPIMTLMSCSDDMKADGGSCLVGSDPSDQCLLGCFPEDPGDNDGGDNDDDDDDEQ